MNSELYRTNPYISTIQKRNNLNKVYRCGDIGPGGAYHDYGVAAVGEGYTGIVYIPFQRGPRNEEGGRKGVLDGDLLEIVRDRLRCFQAGDYACEENAQALRHIEEALMWMNKRAEDRAERNVLGTYQK